MTKGQFKEVETSGMHVIDMPHTTITIYNNRSPLWLFFLFCFNTQPLNSSLDYCFVGKTALEINKLLTKCFFFFALTKLVPFFYNHINLQYKYINFIWTK